MANSNYGELRQLFETFTRVWKAGGQTSLHLHTQDGQARAMLDIQLGPPGDPRPGAPDVRGEGPGQDHGPQHLPHQGHPRRRGPSARARDSARRAAWLQKKHYEQQDPPAEQSTEIIPDTETVSANPTASSNELVERVEADTEDSDLSDVIPQLDGPAEETPTSDEETMEEDSDDESEFENIMEKDLTFKCEDCEYTTGEKQDLVKHAEKIHYQCAECGDDLPSKADLKRHKKEKHCDNCGKVVNSYWHRKYHDNYNVCGKECYVEFYNTIVNPYHHQDIAIADSSKWFWG